MNFEIQISDLKFKKKPDGDYGKISKSINNKRSLDIYEFAKKVGEEGRSFTPAVFKGGKRSRENWERQQLFVLDFDGGLTLEELKERTHTYQLYPAVTYHTFSSTNENPRFRAVFVNDCMIENRACAKLILQMLYIIFPEADANCIEVARMFLGGKGVIDVEEKTINIYDLSISMQAYLKDEKGSNYVRELEKCADQLSVRFYNDKHVIGIWKKDDGESELVNKKNEENLNFTSNIILVSDKKSSNKYLVEMVLDKKFTPSKSAPSQAKKNLIRNQKCDDIKKKCMLFRDFCEKDDIPHNLKFLLATNLCYIDGGKKMFFAVLPDHRSKWEITWKDINAKYKPQGCKNGGCPYVEQCGAKTLVSKLRNTIYMIGNDEEYISIDDAQELLQLYLKNAIERPGKGIRLISAQTALGKTKVYCDMAKSYEWQKNPMIVVPTTKLQEEVGGRLRSLGVECYLTPNFEKVLLNAELFELHSAVKNLYDSGFGYKAKGYIRGYLEKNEASLTECVKVMLKEYLEFTKKLNGKICVVTTHAMFLSLSEELLEKYEIIIDEDIMMSIFRGTNSISFDVLSEALQCDVISQEIKQRIAMILDEADGSIKYSNFPKMNRIELDELYKSEMRWKESFPQFVDSHTYYVDKKEKKVYYFVAVRIPDVKMTIVSATLNSKLYQDYCNNRNIVCSDQKVVHAKYKGQLLQYSAYSMSRDFIRKIGFDVILKRVREITNCKDEPVITFKKYAEYDDIYFGKTEGFNQYEGRNIIIIGTPHGLPITYQLIGKHLGYLATEKLCVRRVTNGRYSFPCMTYKDKNMRNLQFFFLESELEQAIGRARLLRHNCTVYLFSNFPCRQARLIQNDFLEI